MAARKSDIIATGAGAVVAGSGGDDVIAVAGTGGGVVAAVVAAVCHVCCPAAIPDAADYPAKAGCAAQSRSKALRVQEINNSVWMSTCLSMRLLCLLVAPWPR